MKYKEKLREVLNILNSLLVESNIESNSEKNQCQNGCIIFDKWLGQIGFLQLKLEKCKDTIKTISEEKIKCICGKEDDIYDLIKAMHDKEYEIFYKITHLTDNPYKYWR